MKFYTHIILPASICLLLAACASDQEQKKPAITVNNPQQPPFPERIVIQPQPITGVARAANNEPTGGYAPTNVQAQLQIEVKDGTEQVKVVRDNTDPYVITKPYRIVKADPYAVRSYLEAAVGAKSVNTSPAQVTAVRFADGTGVVLVSAEEYRFSDSTTERGIDSIAASLDRTGLTFLPDAGTRIYFPRYSRASNLRDMVMKVGSYELDPQFAVSPSTVLVDGELNALLVRAPEWIWEEMRAMLIKYDRPIPEVRISYRIIEIYAENDDRIGVDFQSWKNNEGVDFFSAGTVTRRNWGTFFTSGVMPTDNNSTSYWNFNPKWNTRYLDFMTSIGKAKVMTSGTIVAQNRQRSVVEVNTGFFYDRTFYPEDAESMSDITDEFAYTEPNPNTIPRESVLKIMPMDTATELFRKAGATTYFTKSGYQMRIFGTQTGANSFSDAIAKVTGSDTSTSALSKYLAGYISADGTKHSGTYLNTDWNSADAAPGVIHGGLQYPMAANGFKFVLDVTPVVTGKAAKLKIAMDSISLLGWNADGSPRHSESSTATTVQIGYMPREFVIGGIKKSESVRSTAGLPYLKDLPVIGRALSTESESIKQSQLVLVAKVEYSNPDDFAGADVRENLGKIMKNVNGGMTSRVGNMFFQQFGLDDDRKDREKRLNSVGELINDEYKGSK